MIADLTPTPTLAVSDVTRARAFYEQTLGLTATGDDAGGVTYRCGGGELFVYQSEYAGTNKATAVTFAVGDDKFDGEIDALRQKGISFMTFDYEGMQWKDDIAYLGESMRAAWFADPDGNIVNLTAAAK